MNKRLLLLSSDKHLQTEIPQWLSEFPGKIALERFSDLQTFKKAYLDARAGEEPSENMPEKNADQTSESTTTTPSVETDTLDAKHVDKTTEGSSSIVVLVLDQELASHLELFKWLTEVRNVFSSTGKTTSDQPLRVMLMANDDSHSDPASLRHESITDLMYKPLDRTLFLQKIELLMAEKEDPATSFLFKQKTKMAIDMGKDAMIERLGDFGLAISNPGPLNPGVFAKIYSPVFGKAEESALHVRSYHSEPHPQDSAKHLCYFSFFGILPEQLSRIRHYIQNVEGNVKKQHKRVPERPRYAVGLDAKHFAVIDMNLQVGELFQEALEKNFLNAKAHHFKSYASFLRTCSTFIKKESVELVNDFVEEDTVSPPQGEVLNATKDPEASDLLEIVGEATGEAPQKVKTAFSFSASVSLIVNGDGFDLVSIDPPPDQADHIFGFTIEEHKNDPGLWLKSLDKEQLPEFLEFMKCVLAGQEVSLMTFAEGPNLEKFEIEIKGHLERAGEADGKKLVRLTIRELVEEDRHSLSYKVFRKGTPREFDRLEAIYIDASLVQVEQEWYDHLLDFMRKQELLQEEEKIPVYLLARDVSKESPIYFRYPFFVDMLIKDIDRKLLLAKIYAFHPDLKPKTESVDTEFHSVALEVRIAKEVQLEEISEFGITIKHPSPLKAGAFMRFYSPIFWHEKKDGIVARSSFSVKDKDNPNIYHCFFNFFGSSDSFLKHIRQYIREEYVSKKEQAQG